MHQTFYIDIDEEITTVVEKLRKTEAPEAVLVVPKRALLIQSIVNLKLLRKVADELGLKVSIVTQDKLGKMLIQKAGISVQQKVEDDYENRGGDDSHPARTKGELKKEIEPFELGGRNVDDKKRLEKIGSADYFISESETDSFSDRDRDWQELENLKEHVTPLAEDFPKSKKVTINTVDNSRIRPTKRKGISAMDVSVPARSLVSKKEVLRPNNQSMQKYPVTSCDYPATDVSSSVQNASNRMMEKSADPSAFEVADNFPEIPFSKTRPNYLRDNQPGRGSVKKDASKDQQLEKFFYANNFSGKGQSDYSDDKAGGSNEGKLKSKFLKTVTILVAVVLAGGLLYGGYLYLPKAKITVFAKKDIKSADTTVSGDVNHDSINYEKLIIPVTLMEFDEEVAKTFEATGKKNVSNKKAKGKITIYNEFSSSPQPLVATTRFLSENQKIFRLVQGVTVPGTTKVGEETKPGVVEAEVIADESGDSFNIEATNFSIPGFKNSGNDKYLKIYAKSSSAMTGGGDGNEEVKVVTGKDISEAKDKISLEISSIVKNKIKDSAESGVVILDDAIVIDEPVYRLSNSEGETVDSFEIKVGAHARALVFSESDARKIANSVISKSGNGKINIDSGAVIIDYGKASVDINLGTIEIKMHASNVAQPNLDLANLKKGLLGKNNDELADYLKTYANIEKAEVEYFPQLFVSKIPLNEKRVEVILNATMPE